MPKKILIVDDSDDNRWMVQLLLSQAGYETAEARNGEEALQAVEHSAPDLILLDVNMPHMNGFDLCAKLKQNIVTADIPIIFVTARSDGEDQVKGLALGADSYLVKPADRQAILSRVKRFLSLRS